MYPLTCRFVLCRGGKRDGETVGEPLAYLNILPHEDFSRQCVWVILRRESSNVADA